MSSRESYTSVINRKAAAKQQLMNVAMGRERADLVCPRQSSIGARTIRFGMTQPLIFPLVNNLSYMIYCSTPLFNTLFLLL